MDFDITKYEELMAMGVEYGFQALSALAILIVGWIMGNWVRNRIHNFSKLDGTIRSFLGGFAKYAILAVSFIAVLGQSGVQTASLLAVLGAAGLAIGLALQGTLSNVASGVMILVLRPFGVGDYITFGSMGGTVKTLGLFGCELSTPENVYVFAPNSKIWGTEITNFSRNPIRRQDLTIGISYDSNIDDAMAVVQNVLDKDERLLREEDKAPIIKVANMGDSSVDLKVRIWSKREDFFAVQWDLQKAIKQALDSNDITIPFPTRTLEIANPEALAGKSKS